MAGTEVEEKKRRETICAVLGHPLRVSILEVLNEGPRSPSQFVAEGLVPDELFENQKQALSLTSYHFRELEKEGCLEVIESIPRRGALEHIYKGKASVYFTDEEFEEMSRQTRGNLSRISLQGLFARADRAVREDTFDSRTDRHLTWMPMNLDERGWREAMEILATTFGDLTQVRHDARDRLAGSGDEAIPITVAMLGFESPPPPPLTDEGA
jgi:hypothetical protein